MPLKNTILFTLIVLCLVACRSEYSGIAIFSLSDGDRKEQLAAKELQRYIYQLTDTLPDVSSDWEFVKQAKTKIIVGSFTNDRIQQIVEELGVANKTVGLEEQEFYIKSFFSKRGKTILIVGGDSQGALYGVYDFLEKSGRARFG